MSTTLNLQQRITMIRSLEQMKTPNTWLHDTFFPDRTPSLTAKVAVDIRRYTRKKAPFVNPKAAATQMERQGYTTKQYDPAYFKPMLSIDPSDSDDKQFGGMILDGGISVADYIRQEKARNMVQNKAKITRAIEYMCATVMDGGVLSIIGEGVNYDIDFEMPAGHKITLAGTDLWTDTTNADPNTNLDDWFELILQASGKVVTDVVMGTTAWKNYKKHPKVTAELDNRRIDTGRIVNVRQSQYPSLKWRGVYGEANIWTYAETWEDDSGTSYTLIPAKKVLLAARGANSGTEYGKIQNVEANAAVKFFIDEFKISNPSGYFQVVESSPLPVMPESEAFLTAQVIA